jgi:hypothetical protein
MHSKLCNTCYATIHAAAGICPNCGARQMPLMMPQPSQNTDGTLWLPIPALIIAIFTFILLLSIDQNCCDIHNKDTVDEIAGLATFSGIALALGIASLASQKRGQGMAIAAVVIATITLLISISLFF